MGSQQQPARAGGYRADRLAWRAVALSSATMMTALGAAAHAQTASTPAPATQAASVQTDAGPANLEEVVVTAEKRPSRALDVAGAVAVVPGEELQTRGLNNLEDLSNAVAGLAISSRGAAGFNQIILRGVTSGSQQTSPTVGIYVDDVPFGTSSPAGTSSLQPDIDPTDVQRIEVLKGPQGTLYGASTLGGLVKYVTVAPDPKSFSGTASAGLTALDDGDVGGVARLAVNLPVIEDKAALRLSLFTRSDPGFINDPVDHKIADNGDTASGGRVSLGLYPTDNLQIRLTAFTEVMKSDATASVDLNANTLQPIYGDLTNGRVTDDFFKSRYNLFSGSVDWNLGPVTLVSATGYGQIKSNVLFDFTPAYGFITSAYSGGALPAGDILGPQNFSSNKFTQELRLDSNDWSRFNWRIGGFYTREDFNIGTQVLGLNPTSLALFPSVFGALSTASTIASYQEEAVFGDVRYALTSAVEIDGGLRWSRNEQHSVSSSAGLLNSTTAPFTPTVLASSSSQSVLTYEASGKWTFATDQMAYVRVASGYRPGGPIGLLPAQIAAGAPTSYKSDTTTDYEIGTKDLLFDRRLSIDADLFYIDWQDIQLPTLVAGFNVLSNGGGAVSQGAEVDASYAATHDLSFGLRAAFTDAHLTENALVAGYAKGDRLPAVPRWDVAGDADYVHSLGAVTGNVGLTVKYESDRDVGQSQAPANPLRVLPAFATVDLRAGLAYERYRLDFYLRNATDERAYYNGGALRAFVGQNVPFTAVVIQPRTFGAMLSARF